MRVLCVAEKPSIARSITEILSGNQFTTRPSTNKYVKNFEFTYRFPSSSQLCEIIVTSVLGHLTQSDFDGNYKAWNSCDPFVLFDAPIKRFVNPEHKGIEKNLQSEARRADQLMIWTDCDREGEHIGSEIVSVCQKVKPRIVITRARFSAIIPAQIHNACRTAGPLDMQQAYAVEARMELDLRIGAALTRHQTLGLQGKFHELQSNVISYGPCQFPTLGFVVDQYDKVKAFIPEPFWYIHVVFDRDGSSVEFKWKRHRLFDWHAAFVLYELCADEPEATIMDVQLKPATKWKPLPLTTVELQKSGSRLLHLTPKAILDIAEKLYQKGMVSYPRTETDQFDPQFDFMSLIDKQINDPQWGQFAHKLKNEGGFQTPRNGKKNDKAHPPIHPTAHANELAPDEKRVYEFITRRYLACCSKNATGKTTTVDIDIAGEQFTASGLVILERNYLQVYVYDKWNGNNLPDFSVGEKFMPSVCELNEGTTSRPNLLTEADLVGLMDKNGIGTDATIAEHISKIIERNYVFKTKEGNTQYLVPSTLGIGLVEGYNAIGLDKSLSKPQLRRETERRMTLICEGSRTKGDVLHQTIDEYRDVFIRTKQAFGTLVERVGKYLNPPPDFDQSEPGNPSRRARGGGANVGSRDGHDSDSDDAANDNPGGRGRGARRRGRATRTRGSRARQGQESITIDDEESPRVQTAARGGRASSRASRSTRGSTTRGATRGRVTTTHQSLTTTVSSSNYPDKKPNCKCGNEVLERTVVKEGPNKGRRFFVCPKAQDDNPCGFQGWADELGSTTGNSTSAGTSGTRSAYKRPAAEGSLGSPSTRRVKSRTGPVDQQTLRCDCQLEATRKIVSKEGPNKGRAFWSCSKVSKTAQCKYFKWEDEMEDDPLSVVTGPSNGGMGGNSGNCFKCGQEGHWSNNCPNPNIGQSKTQITSNYTCFTCNQQGHLSTSCPNKNNNHSNAKEVSSSNQCFQCGQSGHWATDCPSKNEGSSNNRNFNPVVRGRGTSRAGARKRGRSRDSKF